MDPMFKTKKVPSLTTMLESSALPRRFSPRPYLRAFFLAPPSLSAGEGRAGPKRMPPPHPAEADPLSLFADPDAASDVRRRAVAGGGTSAVANVD